jgi:hypothetical protein
MSTAKGLAGRASPSGPGDLASREAKIVVRARIFERDDGVLAGLWTIET